MVNVIQVSSKSEENNGTDEVESKVKVFLRMRPMNKLELSRRSKHCVQISSFNNRSKGRVHIDSPLEGEYAFNFDRVSSRYIQNIFCLKYNPHVEYDS